VADGEPIHHVAETDRDEIRRWREIVGRYGALTRTLVREQGLGPTASAELLHDVWVELVAFLSGQAGAHQAVVPWLITTVRRQARNAASGRGSGDSRRIARVLARSLLLETDQDSTDQDGDIVSAIVAQALSRLPSSCQQLLRATSQDPPSSYAEVSRALGMAVGSIGPSRARCLARLQLEVRRLADELVMPEDVGLPDHPFVPPPVTRLTVAGRPTGPSTEPTQRRRLADLRSSLNLAWRPTADRQSSVAGKPDFGQLEAELDRLLASAGPPAGWHSGDADV